MEEIIQKLRDLRDETPCDEDSHKLCGCEKFDEIIDDLTDFKVLHDLKEWIHVFCSAQDTDWENLGEGSVQEIRNFLKEDNYTDQQIDQAINNLNYFYNN